MLELFTWSLDKQTLMDGLVAYNFASYRKDRNGKDIFILHPEVRVDHIGQITKIIGTNPETRKPILEKVTGHHANLICFGELEQWFLEGKEQYDESGKLKSIFERTKLLDIIEGLEFVSNPHEGVPPGYVGPSGLVLIDPAQVRTRRRCWA